MSNRFCWLLASRNEMEWESHLVPASKQSAETVWHIPDAVFTVVDSWWWTERPSERCRVLLTYLLTPWSRVLLEKLTVNFAASQEIPHIYGTRKFLTVPTSARHLSLSWANSIQSPQPTPTSWRSILILSSHCRVLLQNKINLRNWCISLVLL
jgi:hypothetical protein